MGIITWIIFGGIAGWLATKLTGTDAKYGIFANIVIGIIGAFIGGLIAGLLGGSGVTDFNIVSFIVAVAGASLLLMVVNSVGSHA